MTLSLTRSQEGILLNEKIETNPSFKYVKTVTLEGECLLLVTLSYRMLVLYHYY